jgi:hypothetical protein
VSRDSRDGFSGRDSLVAPARDTRAISGSAMQVTERLGALGLDVEMADETIWNPPRNQ